MFDRKLLLGPGLAIALAIAPVGLAQSGQSGTSSDPANQQGTVGSSQSGTDSTTAPDTTTQSDTTTGQSTMGQSTGTEDHSQLVSSATDIFRQASQGTGIPSNVMQSARAIAIIPSGSAGMGAHGGMGTGAHGSMGTGAQSSTGSTGSQDTTGSQGTTGSTTGSMGTTQGSMGMSADSGRGLIVRKNTDGSWSRTPAFIRMSGGTTELQSSTTVGDLVLVFAGEDSINALMDGSLDLATEVTVQAGPSGSMGAVGSTGGTGTTDPSGTTGSTATSGTVGTTPGSMGSTGTTGTQDTTQPGTTGTMTPQSGRAVVYAYSRSAGSFSGTSLTSGTITFDDSANQSAYGRQVSARDLLSGDSTQAQAQASGVLQPFVDAVSSQAPSRAE